MSDLPDGYEWFLEPPEPWKYPTELKRRPSGPTIGLLVDIISSNLVGDDIIEAAAKMITAQAALNKWLRSRPGSWEDLEGLARLVRDESYIVRDIYHPWVAFRDATASACRDVAAAEAERAALFQAIMDGVSRLNGIRQLPLPPESQG
jgi:hypothetical protein